jgi:hypothetical protein
MTYIGGIMGLKEMNTGDRLILFGNLLGSLAMTLISLGGILRTKELPDKPLFSVPSDGSLNGGKNTSNHSNYWER